MVFAPTLSEEVPWLFKEGKGSSWSSTSSELLASTVAMLIFHLGGLESSRAAAEVIIRGGADNSAYEALSLSLRRASTKMLLMLVLTRLAQASHKLGVRLALTWRPRGYPADDLTNEDFAKFMLEGWV